MRIPRFSSRSFLLAATLSALALAVLPVSRAGAQTAAGSLDTGFTLGDVIGSAVYSIAEESDGKVVLGGTFASINGTPLSLLARVNADGSVDTSFNEPLIESYNTRTDTIITAIDPTYTPVVQVVAPQADGKILVGGNFYFINGTPGYGGLIRLNADGTVDSTFSAPRFSGTVYQIVPLAGGGYLIGGDFTFVDTKNTNCLVRLKANGKVDTNFDSGAFSGALAGSSSFPAVHAVAVQTDGSLLVGGSFSKIGQHSAPGLARLKSDGGFDTSYHVDPAFNPADATGNSTDEVLTIALQGDSKALVGGLFIDPATNKPANSLFRLNADGSLDASFNAGGAGTDGIVDDIQIQGDGKILICGGFTHYDGATRDFLARLLPDGTLDTSFDATAGTNTDAYSLFIQSNGQLLVGGIFRQVNGAPRALAGRLNLEAGVAPAVVVSIVATDRRATQFPNLTRGFFTITRAGGNLTVPLIVNYTVSGTAEAGVDYRRLTGTVTIPAGATKVRVKVKPLSDPVLSHKRKVVLTLQAAPTYALGNGRAIVKIINALTP